MSLTRLLRWPLLGTLVLVAACGGDDDGGGGGGDGDGGGGGGDGDGGGELSGQIFDHNHLAVDDIPESCLSDLKSGEFVFHYAHRSHGSQIIVGADSLEAENLELGFDATYCSIPDTSDVLKMWDGMTDNNLVYEAGYWDSEDGLNELRGILNDNPSLKYSMWAWSFEILQATSEIVDTYLAAMDSLEDEFPDVKFIYMTGPAPNDTFNATNRFQRNQQIREYAQENGKLLYDFEDLDTWYDGEQNMQDLDGTTVPVEHPQFDITMGGNTEFEFSHTTQDSCEQKARAFWVMMSILEGCAG